ncbi:hypothetical protein D3C72_1981330 [compost metagenome]
MQPAPLLIGHHRRRTGDQHRIEAITIGVVGHHQKIQRPRQFDRLAAGRGDLLAAGETISLLRPQARTEDPGVHGHGRVQMGIAEQRTGRIVMPDIGRIGRLGRLGGCALVCHDG